MPQTITPITGAPTIHRLQRPFFHACTPLPRTLTSAQRSNPSRIRPTSPLNVEPIPMLPRLSLIDAHGPSFVPDKEPRCLESALL